MTYVKTVDNIHIIYALVSEVEAKGNVDSEFDVRFTLFWYSTLETSVLPILHHVLVTFATQQTDDITDLAMAHSLEPRTISDSSQTWKDKREDLVVGFWPSCIFALSEHVVV